MRILVLVVVLVAPVSLTSSLVFRSRRIGTYVSCKKKNTIIGPLMIDVAHLYVEYCAINSPITGPLAGPSIGHNPYITSALCCSSNRQVSLRIRPHADSGPGTAKSGQESNHKQFGFIRVNLHAMLKITAKQFASWRMISRPYISDNGPKNKRAKAYPGTKSTPSVCST